MWRARATRRPIACSAADTTVDSGAFATTIPRRVAASTSTLSTPTPARPITLSRSARSISSAVVCLSHASVFECVERCSDRRATLDVGPQLGEDELDAGERGRDVEDVVVADVADPEDLPLERTLARCEHDPVPVAKRLHELRGVDAVGCLYRRHHGGAVVVGREELEAHRLRSGAARAS